MVHGVTVPDAFLEFREIYPFPPDIKQIIIPTVCSPVGNTAVVIAYPGLESSINGEDSLEHMREGIQIVTAHHPLPLESVALGRFRLLLVHGSEPVTALGAPDLLQPFERETLGHTLFGLPYSQYVRPDIDFRYYNIIRNNHSIVYRFYGGIGIPYGNSFLLPFEKAFFTGGANGMRGWKMYSLGPGTYKNIYGDFNYNQIGDIQLEANVEYRFPVYQWIRGALFFDAGNIWLLQDSKDLPGGKFTFPGFLNQIGLDGGIGVRLDFDFFIFRFDPAIPLYNPSNPSPDQWMFRKMQFKSIVWNFGIGYPF